ncbi:TIGR03619 family F420-dependent LLM class oxidoreductase [Microbacterium sp. NPDC055357]
MKLAVHFGAHDLTADPGQVAYEAEIRGFDGIVFPEHTHMPVEHGLAPYSGTEDRMMHYRRIFNPFVAMAWAAARTTTLSIGTAVALPGEHDPIILAKTLASLDHLSKGRIVYGAGFGWSEQEMIDHGVDPKRRRAVAREKLLAVQAIWSEDEASYSGEFVNFPPAWNWPKPDSLSRVPILIGAKGTDRVFDHVVEYGHGWIPSVREDTAAFATDVARLKAKAEDAGRDPESLLIHAMAPNRSVQLLEGLREAGAHRAILHLPFAGLDDVRIRLDEYAREYLPRFTD